MISATDIEAKVKAIIYDKIRVEEKDITPQSDFKNDFGADSLDSVDLIMAFEKEFNITIPDEDAVKINTVGDTVQYIKKSLEQRIK